MTDRMTMAELRDKGGLANLKPSRNSFKQVTETAFAAQSKAVAESQAAKVGNGKAEASQKPKKRKPAAPKSLVAQFVEREAKPGVRFVLGVDPGVETGLAYFDGVSGEWLDVGTVDFHALMSWADSVPRESRERFIVIVENAKAMPVFRRKYGEKEARAAQAQARSIGQNNRESELVIGELRRRGFSVVEYAPKSTWKNKVHKWTQEECRSITGYEPRTNQHVRDAMRMAWEHRHLANMPENTRVLTK